MMKEKIYFELVKDMGSQRIYRASKPLTKKADGKPYHGLGGILKVFTDATKAETKEWEIPPFFNLVVVSDAHTHLERLAFPCWDYNSFAGDDTPYLWRCDTIAGVNTMIIHGGCRRSVKPDNVYLRMIAKGNGFQYARQ